MVPHCSDVYENVQACLFAPHLGYHTSLLGYHPPLDLPTSKKQEQPTCKNRQTNQRQSNIIGPRRQSIIKEERRTKKYKRRQRQWKGVKGQARQNTFHKCTWSGSTLLSLPHN